MFTSVNYMSVTVWVLMGILVLILIGVIFWRIFESDQKKQKFKEQNIGSISKEMNDFILSFSETDQLLFHNILFKNKFAKKNLSLIPILIIKNKNVFIVSNMISSKKTEKVILNSEPNPQIVKGKKQFKLNEINFNWYKEIERWLKSYLPEGLNYKVVVPVLTNSIEVINNTEHEFCYVSEFEKYLDSFSSEETLDDSEKNKIIKKMHSINLWKNKKSINEMKDV